MTAHKDSPKPWDSEAIPGWTLAPMNTLTPSGLRAVFRSSPHAWFALRLVYLSDVASAPAEVVAEQAERYWRAWNRFVRHGVEMRRLVESLDDLEKAADIWNEVDQREVDDAFTTVICERDPWPRINLATMALNHFQLGCASSEHPVSRDRPLTRADNEAAWRATRDGACRGCGTPTISQRQYDKLRRVLVANRSLFDLTPTYPLARGGDAPLWSSRVLIAAKGVADHQLPRSQGGRTSRENLANVCAGCNYSRHNTSLDAVRVAAYT